MADKGWEVRRAAIGEVADRRGGGRDDGALGFRVSGVSMATSPKGGDRGRQPGGGGGLAEAAPRRRLAEPDNRWTVAGGGGKKEAEVERDGGWAAQWREPSARAEDRGGSGTEDGQAENEERGRCSTAPKSLIRLNRQKSFKAINRRPRFTR